MNNSVKNYYGETVGFRCWTCGEVFPSMWGENCNKCRNQKDENRKMREEIARLTEAIKQSKP